MRRVYKFVRGCFRFSLSHKFILTPLFFVHWGTQREPWNPDSLWRGIRIGFVIGGLPIEQGSVFSWKYSIPRVRRLNAWQYSEDHDWNPKVKAVDAVAKERPVWEFYGFKKEA